MKETFPGPVYNDVIEKDRQIISVPLEHVEWGGRAPSTNVNVKNEQTIKHVSGSRGEK